MFDLLGVTAAIRHVAVLPDALVMKDGVTGDEVTRIPLGAAFGKRFGNPYAVIHRGDLHQVVLDACRQLPGITLSVKQQVTGFSRNGDGVNAELADGSRVGGCALIGADGLWSGDPRATGRRRLPRCRCHPWPAQQHAAGTRSANGLRGDGLVV